MSDQVFRQQPGESCPESYNDRINIVTAVFPLQDYWFSLVFKRLVGPRVLAVRVAGLQRKPQPGRVIRDKLRIYAHCTSFDKYVL